MNGDNEFDPYNVNQFDPYDTSQPLGAFDTPQSSEIQQKIQAHNQRQGILQDRLEILKENPFTSWQPEWFVKWSMNLADKGLDFLNAIPNTTWSEKVLIGKKAGKTLDEIKAENPRLWSHQKHLGIVKDTLDDFTTDYIDKEGNVLDVVGLLESGEIKKAAEVASEQAVSNIFSFLATAVNPIAGGAMLATQVYGQELETGLDRYNGKKEVDYDKIRKNSLWKAGNEFIGEMLGGVVFRKVAGLRASGLAEDAVKTYTDSFVKKLTKGFFGGFGSEFLAEGMTNNLNQLSDQMVFGDEKTAKDYFRGFINDGIIGGVLGGPLGGGMRAGNSASRQDAIEMIASRKWQNEMHDLTNKIDKAENDVSNANDRTKSAYEKRLDNLKKQKKQKQKQLDVTWENKTDKEIVEYAKKFDKANKEFDIVLDANAAPEDREIAKQNIQKLYGQMALDTDGFVNTKVETIIGSILKTAEVNSKKGISSWWKKDLDIKYLKNDVDIAKAVEESGEQGLTGSEGMFMAKKDGKYIVYINENVAAAAGATNVLGHELLHYVFAKNFKTDNAAMKPLVDSFVQYLKDNGNGDVVARIENRMRENGYVESNGDIKDGNLEEYFEMFTDLIDEGAVVSNEDKSAGIIKATNDVLVGLGLKSVKLNTGKEVFDFLKLYHKNLNRTGILGKLTRRGILNTRLESGVVEKSSGQNVGSKKSRSTVDLEKGDGDLSQKIDRLTKGAKTIDEFQKPGGEFDNVYTGILDGKFDRVFGEGITQAQKEIQRQNLADRLINFDPAKTPELSKWLYGGSGKAGNVVYAGLVAKKKLFEAGEKAKRETSIDTQEAKELTNESTETKKQEPKGQKARILKSLADINIDNKEIISSTARAEINSLIEQNPKNLEAKISEIIDEEITKAVKAQMGKISKEKGEVVISDEYKAFIAFNYTDIVQSLDVATIKKNYNTLFELTEIGKEDRKTKKSDKPSLKKDSNYRKGIFKIETNKAKFTKFFIEGGYTTLLARQKGLANQIAKGIVEDIVSNEIINNSSNIDAILKAEIQNLVNQLNKQKNEVVGNYADQIKFSKTYKQDITQQVYKLTREVYKAKIITDVFNLETQKVKKGKYDPWVVRTVFEQWMKGNIYVNQDQAAVNALQKIPSKVIKENRGTALEQFIINLGVQAAKKFDGLVMLGETVMEGGIPDFFASIHGFALYAETKFGKARAGKTSINYVNYLTGEFKVNKVIEGNIDLVNEGVKRALKKGSIDLVKTLKDLGVDLVDSDTVVPLDAHLKVNKGGLSDATVMVTGKFIANLYTNKEYPVFLIEVAGGGLHYMEGDPFITELAKELGIPLLEGQFPLKTRILASSVKENKETIGYKYKLTAEPEISASMLKNKSPHTLTDIATFEVIMKSKAAARLKTQQEAKSKQTLGDAIKASRTVKDPKGITVLDFDDTLATSKSLIKYTQPDGTKGTLTPEQYASTYQDLQDLGYEFDFSEFNKVVDGKVAPLFQKALKLQSKFGPENMFVLTARPAESAAAIFAFIKANGLNIPLKNITGLANSTAEAKALWIAEKVSEGYNDFYFADDALQNVQAVKNMLDQFDVKSKVQQARVKFSKTMNDTFNDILENVTGIESQKRFDFIKARKRGASKGKFRFFIPPSHEDFVGLLYNFMGKGKKGDAHREFLEQSLVRPLNRANKEYDTARQSVATDYKNLNKQMPDVKKKLIKKTPDGDFTYQDAIRIYLWDKHGYNIPGLSEIDQAKLVELVKSDGMLQSYADAINIISKQETYVDPTDGWDSGDIRMDLDDATGRIGRAQFFEEFSENADIIFSKENLNKIEAGYGKGVREALEDILYRIKTGRNKPTGKDGRVNTLMNWLNGSVGSVMFFNMRSALLQQMSIVNYINFADNNIFAAAKAFANQKQYWSDWAFIFNSDMLKQRRGGIMTDVNGAELAADMRKSKNPHRFLISKLLELGFLPTQIGDNIAIATGGASYYRNRINKYIKEGLNQKEAEAKAFTDFQDITQSTQQSARPDMVSQQQASVIGKVILNFQNVTSQFNRLGKKAFQDIYNRRITKPNSTQMQSDISNASRITYYFAVQNAIFYTLQTALFAMMFDDDEEDVNNLFLKKKERLINGSIDSILRGTGLYGSVVATLKNVAIAFARQRDVNYNPDESAVVVEALNLSPVLGIKARKIVNAEKTLNYNKKVIKEMETFDIDNPQWSAVTSYTEGFTNLPLNRLYNKTQNIRQGLNNDHAAWERTLLFLGWSQYNLNLENEKMDKIKESTKAKNKRKKKLKIGAL